MVLATRALPGRARPLTRLRAVMSATGDTSVVLHGITAGAVDYLLKPVRIEELRNLWQHVVRRRQEGSGGSPPRPEGRGAEKALGRTSKEKGKRMKDGCEGNEVRAMLAAQRMRAALTAGGRRRMLAGMWAKRRAWYGRWSCTSSL